MTDWSKLNPPITAKWSIDYNMQPVDLGIDFDKSEPTYEGQIVLGNHTGNDKRILVFQCFTCPSEFDIETMSFTKLLDEAKAGQWSIKFNDQGYNVHCPDCARFLKI